MGTFDRTLCVGLMLAVAICITPMTMADYLTIVGTQDSTCSTTSTLMYNIEPYSNDTDCFQISATITQYLVAFCYPNGTANLTFSNNADCSVSPGADGNLPIQPLGYGVTGCWTSTGTGDAKIPQVPGSIVSALRVTCYSGNIPVPAVPTTPPVAPVSPPVAAPVKPPTAPVASPPTTSPPTAPTAPTAPVSPPAAPVASPTAPVAAPVTPPTTPPTAPPTAPVTAPNPAMAVVGTTASLTVYTGNTCTGTTLGSKNVSTDPTQCQYSGFSDFYYAVGCTTDQGIPYGWYCNYSDCGNYNVTECIPWPTITSSGSYFDTPVCEGGSGQGFSIAVTCYPVYEYQTPQVPQTTTPYVPVAPTPITPTHTPPSSTPSGSAPSGSAPTTSATVTVMGGEGLSCPVSSGSTASLANSTSCQLVDGSVGMITYCSATGSPIGSICTSSSCSSGCTAFGSATAVTWGNPYCVNFEGLAAFAVTCNLGAVPLAPTAAPVVPSGPAPVSTGQPVTLVAYLLNNCVTQALSIPLVANISKCQHATPLGQSVYLKLDCELGTNHTVQAYGYVCGSDSTCSPSSCTPIPPSPSDKCVNYAIPPAVQSIEVSCPSAPWFKTSDAPSTFSASFSLFIVSSLFALLAFF